MQSREVSPTLVRLRADVATIQRALTKLDADAAGPRACDLRSAPRHVYRASGLSLDLLGDGGQVTQIGAVGRNMSRGGIGVITSSFVYPGSQCRITLQPLGAPAQVARGRVVRCRFISGGSPLYEVGIRFEQPIDVALFTTSRGALQVLVVETRKQFHELIDGFLDGLETDLRCAHTAVDAACAAMTTAFDLVLVDLDAPQINGFTLVRELRRAGHLGATVGMTLECTPETQQRCAASGFTGVLTKPLTRDLVRQLLDSLRHPPLLSSYTGDVRLASLIDRFVAGLREQARALQIATEEGDVQTVHVIARRLRADAGSYGFPVISEEAAAVQSLAAVQTDVDSLRAAVFELIDLCLAARPTSSA